LSDVPRTAMVVVPGVDGRFSYRVPERLQQRIAEGMRALVRFGPRRVTGMIVALHASDDPKATRDIEHLLDERPAFSRELLSFTNWVSDYYLCPWGDVLKAALPAGMSLDEKRYWVAAVEPNDPRVAAFLTRFPEATDAWRAMAKAPLSSERGHKLFKLSAQSGLGKKLTDAGLADFRPVLKSPRVKTQYDSVVTLAEAARKRYGDALFTTLRSVHEQHLVREVFESGPEGVLRSDLLRGSSSARRQAFARLLAASTLELRVEEVSRWDPHAETTPEFVEPTNLTADQQNAVAAVHTALQKRNFAPFLLFGVTGSGKTQVYIEAIRHVLTEGASALVLLPEIALTPFIWGRFYRAFGDKVAIQHSAQSPAVRYDLWREIRAGRYPVVVGARSAVFAPLENLALIVVDEEQEASYKQDEPEPRYHARDAALMRAHMAGAAIVLGSATPSVESFFHARAGRYQLLSLPQRVGGSVLPSVQLVQRKPRAAATPEKESAESDSTPPKKRKRARVFEIPLFTDELLAALRTTFEQRKQAILLQNRRGFAPFLLCSSCGKIPVCEQCSVSLTYHRRGLTLRCHYCGHREPAPDACPRCGSLEWIAEGYGTQRIEEELATHFPEARILRMDSDTVSRRGTHGHMVAAFAAHEYDVLVGTQMIAKGMDFPDVGLAAVMQADTELFYPDFRSSERAAGLIMQVAGRAGRREDPGSVIIQSAVGSHPVLSAALKGDWEEIVDGELQSRKQSLFPPSARLILLRAVSENESAAARALLKLRRLLQDSGANVLGPAPEMVTKIRNRYRYHLLVRTARANDSGGSILRQSVQRALVEFKKARGEAGVVIEVDVDPQSVA
jgi:primosomal protein N' (replication factor Y) (superfamily II helicase)